MKITIIKKGLIIYLAALVAGIIFASFYGGPVAYAPLFALFLIIPVSIIYIVLNYAFLRVYQEVEVHKLTKGEEHKYRALVENAGFLPIHNMEIGTFKSRCNLYEIPDKTKLSLDIHEKKELLSGINCLFAGVYDVGLENVSFTDPFRIFSVSFNIPYSFRAIVKPRITEIAGKTLDLENLYSSRGRKSERIFEDTPGNDIRQYVRGDSLSAINWKVSAKASKLMVRVPDKMEKRTLSILMNADSRPESEQDTEFLIKRDYFLEFVVSAAWLFGNQGIPVTIVYPAGTVREQLVDSRESFMEFYNTVSDGLLYSSDLEYSKIFNLVKTCRSMKNDRETWIVITENPGEGENFISICD
jgi:uncharacterized protein (DUF58 family)